MAPVRLRRCVSRRGAAFFLTVFFFVPADFVTIFFVVVLGAAFFVPEPLVCPIGPKGGLSVYRCSAV